MPDSVLTGSILSDMVVVHAAPLGRLYLPAAPGADVTRVLQLNADLRHAWDASALLLSTCALQTPRELPWSGTLVALPHAMASMASRVAPPAVRSCACTNVPSCSSTHWRT